MHLVRLHGITTGLLAFSLSLREKKKTLMWLAKCPARRLPPSDPAVRLWGPQGPPAPAVTPGDTAGGSVAGSLLAGELGGETHCQSVQRVIRAV